MQSPPVASSSTGPRGPSTPRRSHEDEWEDYHPSQDDGDVRGETRADDVDDDSSSVAVSLVSGKRRQRTPGRKSAARTRARQVGVGTPPADKRTPSSLRRRTQHEVDSPVSSPTPKARRQEPLERDPKLPDRLAAPPELLSRLVSVLSLVISWTYRLLLALITLASALLAPYLMPLVLASFGTLLVGSALYVLLPRVPSILVSVTAALLRRVLPGASLSLGSLSDLGVLQSAAIGPARTAATPLCAVLGIACEYSLLSAFRPPLADPLGETPDTTEGESSIARPFWRWHWTEHFPSILPGRRRGAVVDIGGVARGLSREVKQARDIFESVQSMGSAGLVRNLHYVKIWELGTAVAVGSNLPERGIVGEELKDLGDMTRDLADEIMGIDHAAVNAFTWIQWEFTSLLEMLDSPNPPSNATISTRLHSLITQLDNAFTELHSLTSVATSTASLASDKGSRLYQSLTKIRYSLLSERDRDPIWRQAWDKNKHRLVGGEIPRSEMLERDLTLTGDTIISLHGAKEHLERVRILTKGYRDQIGLSQARMVGFHLGAESAGVDAQEEVRLFGRLVSGLGEAVGEAKRRGRDQAPRRKGYREIEA